MLSWDELVAACTELGDGAFLATVQADGRPHVSWVGVGFGDECLWTATYASSQKARNLRHTNDVALHWPERPDRLIFMRATARLVVERAEIERLWADQVVSYDLTGFFGSVDNPELLFVQLIPYRASVHDGDPSHPALQWRPRG